MQLATFFFVLLRKIYNYNEFVCVIWCSFTFKLKDLIRVSWTLRKKKRFSFVRNHFIYVSKNKKKKKTWNLPFWKVIWRKFMNLNYVFVYFFFTFGHCCIYIHEKGYEKPWITACWKNILQRQRFDISVIRDLNRRDLSVIDRRMTFLYISIFE